jgi:hypothetical protein
VCEDIGDCGRVASESVGGRRRVWEDIGECGRGQRRVWEDIGERGRT